MLGYEYDSTRLTVFFNQTLTRTDTFQLKIRYQANPEKVKGLTGEAITDAKGFLGVGGAFKFNKDGSNNRATSIVTPKNGQIIVLDPAPKNFNSILMTQ